MNTISWVETGLREFVDSIISTYFIIDYGIVTAFNGDSVDVLLSTLLQQKEATTIERRINGIKVLYPSSSSFSLKWNLSSGDKVLLLGLRDKVDINAKKPINGGSIHYDIDTMVAYPVSSFNEGAKVAMQISEGNINASIEKDFSYDGKGKMTIKATGDVVIETQGNVTVNANGSCNVNGKAGVKINGSTGAMKVI